MSLERKSQGDGQKDSDYRPSQVEQRLTTATWENLLTKTANLSNRTADTIQNHQLYANDVNGLYKKHMDKGLNPHSRIGKLTFIPDVPVDSDIFKGSVIAESFGEAPGIDTKGRNVIAQLTVTIDSDRETPERYPAEAQVETTLRMTDAREVIGTVRIWRPIHASSEDQPNPELAYVMKENGIPFQLETIYDKAREELDKEEALLTEKQVQKIVRFLQKIQ